MIAARTNIVTQFSVSKVVSYQLNIIRPLSIDSLSCLQNLNINSEKRVFRCICTVLYSNVVRAPLAFPLGSEDVELGVNGIRYLWVRSRCDPNDRIEHEYREIYHILTRRH